MTAAQALFRIGFVSDLMMQLSFFFLSLTLYRLFKSVHKGYAGLMVGSVMVSVAIMCTNMLHHYAAMMILDGEDYLSSFNSDQLNSLVLLFSICINMAIALLSCFLGYGYFP